MSYILDLRMVGSVLFRLIQDYSEINLILYDIIV